MDSQDNVLLRLVLFSTACLGLVFCSASPQSYHYSVTISVRLLLLYPVKVVVGVLVVSDLLDVRQWLLALAQASSIHSLLIFSGHNLGPYLVSVGGDDLQNAFSASCKPSQSTRLELLVILLNTSSSAVFHPFSFTPLLSGSVLHHTYLIHGGITTTLPFSPL